MQIISSKNHVGNMIDLFAFITQYNKYTVCDMMSQEKARKKLEDIKCKTN